jgi:TolA-binding protein
VGAGVGVLAIAAIAGSIGAYIATRGSSPPQPAPTSSPVAEAPPAGAPAAATTASGAPSSSVLPRTVAPTPAPPAPAAASKPSTPPTTASKAPARPPARVAPTASTAAAVSAPPPVSKDDEAQQKLEVARAKMANQLNEQALADLRQILLDYPGSRAAAEASFLAAELLEKVGKLEDAMAAHVEFESRFAGDQRVAESKLRRAQIMARTRLPQAEVRARDLLNQVVRDYPGSPPAWQALQAKRRIESERRNMREFDPVLKTQVPVVVFTLRQIIEQFPRKPESVVAYSQLALMYTQMDRHAEAVRVLEALVANFPDNNGDVWFRIGEIYERRLRDSAKAREAYARVPPGSTNYAEAQRRLGRKP